MKYAYEDLSPEQFERLIVLLCQRLLGISVQGFANGPDGGRDAKFVGTAELHPSRVAPWSGTTIIQAKHTNGYNRNFSETDFFSITAANTVLGKEIPRVIKLRKRKQIDHYMLFANRRLSANAETNIRGHISSTCSIPESSIYLCGLEQLELWLKTFLLIHEAQQGCRDATYEPSRFPVAVPYPSPHRATPAYVVVTLSDLDTSRNKASVSGLSWISRKTFGEVAKLAELDPIDSPLIVSPDELAEVVQALARNKAEVAAVLDDPPTQRVSYEEKNTLNEMTAEYAKRYGKGT